MDGITEKDVDRAMPSAVRSEEKLMTFAASNLYGTKNKTAPMNLVVGVPSDSINLNKLWRKVVVTFHQNCVCS